MSADAVAYEPSMWQVIHKSRIFDAPNRGYSKHFKLNNKSPPISSQGCPRLPDVCAVTSRTSIATPKAKSKAAWMTKRGFLWPFPRSRQELIAHPRKPSGSRIDLLKEPWVENELLGWTEDGATGGRPEGYPPSELAWRPKFDPIPSNGQAMFGGLQVILSMDNSK